MSQLPTYSASPGACLSEARIRDHQEPGKLIFKDFVSPGACRALRVRAHERVAGFVPETVRRVFSTAEKRHPDNRYFIECGERIRLFGKAEEDWLQRSPTLSLRGLVGSQVA